MNYIVFDLEWNQCPAGKEKENQNLPFEIIEIGAVKMDSSYQILDSFHEIVRPQVYQTLHFMTREIIHFSEKDWKDCATFPEVIQEFIKWCGPDPAWCTWGPGDLSELQRNMEWYHIPLPFSFPLIFYDIQKIFSIVYEDRKTRRSLESVVEYFDMPHSTAFHNAWADARFTAEIMKHLTEKQILTNYSIDCYRTPQTKKQEIYVTYPTYFKYISKPFSNKTEAMKDRTVTSTRCYLCKKTAKKKIRWFSSGSKNYFCLARCEEHGWLKGKIRIRHHADNSYYVVKTIKQISEEDAAAIKNKQELLRLKRKMKRSSS